MAIGLYGLQGCSSMDRTSRLGFVSPSAQQSNIISISPWLSDTKRLTLNHDSATLQKALQSTDIAKHRSNLQQAGQVVGQTANSNARFFEDNLITIQRRDEHWYFLEPISLLEIYVGHVPLRANDHIGTLPFRISHFANARFNSEFHYGLVEPGLSIEQVRAVPKSIDASILQFVAGNAERHAPNENWTVTILNRRVGNVWHRLVLPANFSDNRLNKALDALAILTSAEAAELMPGDIVEKTNWIALKNKLE